MNIRYRVTLSSEERSQLQALIAGGKAAVRKVKRAQILLAAAAGSKDETIAANVGVGTSTVYRTKQRFVEEGLERALAEAPRPRPERKLAVEEEALLVAIACSGPPRGRARWTLQLLADEMVRLTAHAQLSDETVRRRLAEVDLKPWQKKRRSTTPVGVSDLLCKGGQQVGLTERTSRHGYRHEADDPGRGDRSAARRIFPT